VSAHLTVGVHVVTRHALLEALVASMAADPELRRSLPLGIDVADPAALAGEVAIVAERMTYALQDATDGVEGVARTVRRRVWAGNRPEAVRPLAHAAALAAVDDDTRVRLRGGLRWRVLTGDPVRLELPGRTLELPAGADATLSVLLAGPLVRTGDLPGSDHVDVVRRLLRDGVLVTDASGGAGSGAGGVADVAGGPASARGTTEA
jgi:hypothetical protein